MSRKDWGYASLSVGFLLIVIAVLMLLYTITQGANAYWIFFYNTVVKIISGLLITGAVFVVIGLTYLRNVVNKWSYTSIITGFGLIAFDATRLVVALQGPHPEGIGWGSFQQNWSLDFFSILMLGCFIIVLGIIIGSRIRDKRGYIIVAGGSTLTLVGLIILSANLVTTLQYYPPHYIISLQEAWNNTVSYFLIAGIVILAIGATQLYRMYRKAANKCNRLFLKL